MVNSVSSQFAYLVIILFISSVSAVPGKVCINNGDCGAFLECKEKVCVCQDGMHVGHGFYNSTCLVKNGNSCEGNKIAKCVENGQCSENGVGGNKVCECKDGFTSTTNGQLCLGGYSTFCNSTTTNCNDEVFLLCDYKTSMCKCEHEGFYYEWSQSEKKCLMLAGRTKCKVGNENPCTTKANCINGMCKCSQGYSANYGNLCQRSFNQTCVGTGPPSEDCNLKEFLVCAGRRCNCNRELNMTYDANQGGCRVNPGGHCDFKLPEGESVHDRRECSSETECSSENECICKNGKEQNNDGTCATPENGARTIFVNYFAISIVFLVLCKNQK